MSRFQDVTLSYNGKDYTVKADQVMKLILILEDIVSLQRLADPNNPPMGKISEAYAAALAYAGCKSVSTEDIYFSLFSEGSAAEAQNAVNGILSMMVPPQDYKPDEQPKKGKGRRKKAA